MPPVTGNPSPEARPSHPGLGSAGAQPGTAPTPQGPPVTGPPVGAAGHVAFLRKADPAVKYVPQETDQAPLAAYLLCDGV